MKTTLDLEPFYRKTIGFDRFFNDLENLTNITKQSYPPYNILKTGEKTYSIEIAVSGFAIEEIEIIKDKNILTVSGSKKSLENEVNYIHKGIATREFNKQFTLADFVEVVDATLKNGILVVSLQRHVPEEHMPKKITINMPTLIEK